jgi:hypothetical protein
MESIFIIAHEPCEGLGFDAALSGDKPSQGFYVLRFHGVSGGDPIGKAAQEG